VRRLREEIRRNGRPSFRHGNRVASLIGGEAPWIPAVLPGVRIVPIRITSVVDAPAYRADRGGATELVESLRAALAAGCKVVNVSLHVPITGPALNAFVRDAVWDDLERAGVVVVCAAGNGREDLDASPRYPACIDRPNILCVGAVGPDGRIAEWGDGGSARGARSVDLMAPGSALVVSDGGGRAVIAHGTSYACALATGAVARLMADEPGLTPGELIERLVADSRSLPVSSNGAPACRGGILRWPQPR
jgi:subtilisin family serine protease